MLEVGAGTQPLTWTTIAEGTAAVVEGWLGTWQVSGLTDGHYVVRLRAIDGMGREFEDRLPLTLGNFPPGDPGYVKDCYGAVSSAIGTLWSNGGADIYFGVHSYVDTAFGMPYKTSQAADDFEISALCETAELTRARVQMNVALYTVSDPPVTPTDGVLRIFADAGGKPADSPLVEVPFSQVPTWVGYYGINLCFAIFEYEIPLPGLRLPPGRYWISPMGSVADEPTLWSFRTAGVGTIQLEEAHFTSEGLGVTSWTPVSDHPDTSYRMTTDLAFEIDGACLEVLFADGFESGNLSAWSATSP